MMFAAPDPVASGREFEVVAVHGRTPHVLADFVGDAVFTLHWEEQDRLVAGTGRAEGAEMVRFTEKDVAHGGKDVSDDHDHSKVHGAHGPAKAQQMFRRKSGG